MTDETIAGMTRPGRFFGLMFSEWGSGLSGPASVPFAILALFASGSAQKLAYASLAITLGFFSAYRIWAKESIRAVEVETELEKLKREYRDEHPQLSMDILCAEGIREWRETAQPAQLFIHHLGGRVPTNIRFDPLPSKRGRYVLVFDPLPHIDPRVKNCLQFEVQTVGHPSLGHRDRTVIGNVTGELLLHFLTDCSDAPTEVEYCLVMHYRDNGEDRDHVFNLRFDLHRFRFTRNTG